MRSEPPSPPQVSPDGKFYWDGTRWVPMQQQTPMDDRDSITSNFRSNFGCFFIGLGVLSFVIFGIVGLAGASGSGGTTWGPILGWSGAILGWGSLLMVLLGLRWMGVRVPRAVTLLFTAALVGLLIVAIAHGPKTSP